MAVTFTRTGAQVEEIHNTVDDLSNIVSNENLISNSSFEIAGNAANPPDATPRSYNAGDELFQGMFAVGALTGVTYIDGKANGTGQLYTDVYKSEKQKLSTASYVPSIAGSNGSPVESGASFVDNVDYWRVTFDMSDAFSVKFEQGSVATGHYAQAAKGKTYTFNSVQGMIEESPPDGARVATSGYYHVLDGGGAEYIISSSVTADGFADIDLGNGKVAVLQGDEIDIRKTGCKPDDYSFDNVDRIKSAILKGRAEIPPQTFYSTPIRLGAEFNNKSMIGYGIKSTLSLIDSSTSGGIPLLHIPQNGGSYGGSEVGAVGFFADMFSLKGSDATSTTTTTGLVVENSVAFKFGTLWTSGFYKSGAIFTGTCTLLDGGTLTSFNNGNQAGASTGGQGVALSLDDSEDIQGRIDRIVGYNNGLSNFGQALDWVEGNIHIGTLHAYDNGSSAMKIVRPSKGRIDNLISQANNKHAGNGFPCLYTNGDFGEFHINYLESDNAAASGIAHTKTGLITIDTANIKNSESNTLTLQSDSGKVSRLNIGKLIANGPSTNLINQSGDSYLEIGEMELSNCPNQGLVLDGTETRLGIITITDSTGIPLWLRGGDITITDAKIVRSDLSGSTACLIDASVSNAAILNLKTKGYATPLSDSGTATYKPNVVSL